MIREFENAPGNLVWKEASMQLVPKNSALQDVLPFLDHFPLQCASQALL